jgi:MFS family permease
MGASRGVTLLLNVGHGLDHLLMLIFPTVVLAMSTELGRSYADLLPLSFGGFIAFGACSIPAGWLADRWSRTGMMTVFFFGIGAASILTGLASGPSQIAFGLTLIGVFAAIYHPVGIAMLVANRDNVGRVLGVNGVFGNVGVAFSALLAGALAQEAGWRSAFIVPGAIAIGVGVAFAIVVRGAQGTAAARKSVPAAKLSRADLARVFGVLTVATACGGVIFNSTTVAMPKIFDERLRALTQTNFGIGALVAIVYSVAAFAQVLMGTLMSRFEMKHLMIGVGLVQIPLLFAAANLDGWALLIVALLMMMAIFGQIPLNDGIVGKYVADEYRARVLSVRYVVSLGVASLAAPMIAFLHRTEGGFRNLFLVLAALAVAIMASALFFPSRRRMEAAQPAL